MRKIFFIGFMLFGFYLTGIVAAERNDIKSCYEHAGITPNTKPQSLRELFVLVDQTTILDVNLKRSVHEKVHRYLQPGDRLKIFVFSAYVGDHYTDLLLTLRLDEPMRENQLDDIPKKQRKAFEHCMRAQLKYVHGLVDMKLKSAFTTEGDIPKTELISSLKNIADSQIGPSPSEAKTVLLISDMLEHSSTTSFYQKNRVRQIEPAAELKKIEQSGLISNFSNAQIYVIGAGLLAPKYRQNAYRSGDVMMALNKFWENYFEKSNGRLIGFGQPSLLMELH